MWYNGIPRASPSEYHYTTLRVQYPYTLENHSTTITYHWRYVEVPGKDTPVGVVLSTRYILKTNLTFVPGYALKEYTNKRSIE